MDTFNLLLFKFLILKVIYVVLTLSVSMYLQYVYVKCEVW